MRYCMVASTLLFRTLQAFSFRLSKSFTTKPLFQSSAPSVLKFATFSSRNQIHSRNEDISFDPSREEAAMSTHHPDATTDPPPSPSSPYPVFLNSDQSISQHIRTSALEWKSTAARIGVRRRMIERMGYPEQARATTIVKFDPNQDFPSHSHPGGEEFLVLEGVWSDGYGDFPKYSYIRNYIGSAHQPKIGEVGCVILVKLCQMTEREVEQEHRAWNGSPENEGAWRNCPTKVIGNGDSGCIWELSEATGMQLYCNHRSIEEGEINIKQAELFRSQYEHTFALQLSAVKLQSSGGEHSKGTLTIVAPEKGMEILVVDGSLRSKLFGVHDEWSWTRLVKGAKLEVELTSKNAYLWVKEGHLGMPEISLEKCM